MNDKIKFTESGLHLATLKIASENNALLRLMLMNQQRIMEKLGLQQDVSDGLVMDLLFLENTTERDPAKQLESNALYLAIQSTGNISSLARERAIQWGKQNSKHITTEEN